MKYKTFRGLAIAGGVLSVLFGCGALAWWCGHTGSDAGDSNRQRPVITSQPPALTPPETPTVPLRPVQQPAAAVSNATAPLTPAEKAKGIPLRPMDLEVLARAAGSISGDKVKDAIQGRSYKVNLYQDAGEAKINRLKIDLDRDDKFDEKWTLSPGRDDIRRQVSTTDDDKTYDVEYRLRGDMWLPK